MIYIYGDSHAHNSFRNLKLNYTNLHCVSITMFLIGRDNNIVNFNIDNIQSNDIIIFVYGEVDCRCHIQRQIDLGRNEDDVINELVSNYFTTLKNNLINIDAKIIIVGVIPPTKRNDYEIINGPIMHDFPFIGSDENRVRYTKKVNKLLEELSINYNYIYFNPYSYYERPDGTLKYELSDNVVHLGDNSFFLDKFTELYNKINNFILRNIEYDDFDKGYMDLMFEFTNYNYPMTKEKFIDFIDTQKNYKIIVIYSVEEKRIIGAGTITILYKIHNNPIGQIGDVIISEKYRKNGFGKKIIEKLIYIGKNEYKCYKIILNCLEKNIKFYENCGFSNVGVEMKLL
jgi:RimJ/RimL family protein N-acetyltransferase